MTSFAYLMAEPFFDCTENFYQNFASKMATLFEPKVSSFDRLSGDETNWTTFDVTEVVPLPAKVAHFWLFCKLETFD